jgi:hypothetical protein
MTQGHADQFGSIFNAVSAKVGQGLHNTRELRKLVDEILWDLVIERFATFGSRDGNAEASHPFIILTERGSEMVKEREPHFYDPGRYLTFVEKLAPLIDDVTKQYAHEAVRCFRHGLLFAAAVMIGAAAERELLNLLKAIETWDLDLPKKAADLRARGRLPAIFDCIRGAVERAQRDFAMPYTVHQGALTHILSFQEMIRVQRNDAVHPAAGTVSWDSVFLALQTFPTALAVIDRLRNWFVANLPIEKIP